MKTAIKATEKLAIIMLKVLCYFIGTGGAGMALTILLELLLRVFFGFQLSHYEVNVQFIQGFMIAFLGAPVGVWMGNQISRHGTPG